MGASETEGGPRGVCNLRRAILGSEIICLLWGVVVIEYRASFYREGLRDFKYATWRVGYFSTAPDVDTRVDH